MAKIMKQIFIFLIGLLPIFSFAQKVIYIDVNATNSMGSIPPIWRDHYENHLMAGYGGNPRISGPHTSFVSDPKFQTEMKELKPRYVRISIGRIDNPPDTNYSSSNINILRNLKYEFYKGENSILAADDPTNYDFSFIDSIITVVKSIGAEPFITMDYMPFTLSRTQIPRYQPTMSLIYNLAFDNGIRNAPPADNAVYGRVMYHFIKHCHSVHGARYFEHWNEPDQMWANPIMAKFFWQGDEIDLYNSYAAIADQITADTALSNHIKLGGCSFAFYSIGNLIPIRFLTLIKNNAKKFDFLSFHPYSDTQYKGGYDTAKVKLAVNWRNIYVPNAELINAEWGRLDPNTTTWGDLDYGLDKFRHLIDMLNRGISMSHDVCLFDGDSSTDNFANLGTYRVGPIVPKPSAYVFYNLNKMNEASERLTLSISDQEFALACKTKNNDKIVVIYPAEAPISGSDLVNLSVKNLPWGNSNYFLYRYELTEQSYSEGIKYNLTSFFKGTGGTAQDRISYSKIGGSGRLIIWEISPTPLDTKDNTVPEQMGYEVFPNPNNGKFFIRNFTKNNELIQASIYNSQGQLAFSKKLSTDEEIIEIDTKLPNGTYFLHLYNSRENITTKLLISK